LRPRPLCGRPRALAAALVPLAAARAPSRPPSCRPRVAAAPSGPRACPVCTSSA